MGGNEKNLDYYMNLKYSITIEPIPAEEGNGYLAFIPQLGKAAFLGSGETIEEALNDLEIVKRFFFEEWLEKGIGIPKPVFEEEEHSGKFIIRIPKILHAHLAYEAKKNSTSMNKYLIYLLTEASTISTIEDKQNSLAKKVDDCLGHFTHYIHSMFERYNFKGMPVIDEKNIPQPSSNEIIQEMAA